MKIKKISVIVLFSASAALVIGFVIKTIVDHRYYTHSVNSAPFGLQIAVNALGFIVPAVILAAVALFILKKRYVLAACGGLFAGIAAGAALFSGNFSDGLIYAIPAALSAVVCGIFTIILIISGKRLTKT